jgi:hypothetical protein
MVQFFLFLIFHHNTSLVFDTKSTLITNSSSISKSDYNSLPITIKYVNKKQKIVLIKREQYYIGLLYPEYNILKTAGSMLGFKHSDKTIELMCAAKFGRNRTEAAKL